MAFEFKLPDLGEGITEGEIVKWRVKEGDLIEEHQVVLEVETDKAIVEVPSPKKGKVFKLNKAEGETVKVGSTLLTIQLEGEAEAASPEKKAEEEKKERVSVSVVGTMPEKEEIMASPKARAMARKLGVDISAVKGTGHGGIVTEDDVRAASTAAAPPAKPEEAVKKEAPPAGRDRFGPVEKVSIKGVRKTIAKNLYAVQNTTVSVTGMDDADVTDLWDLKARERKVARERGIHLTFMPFVMKAVQHALTFHPYMNASVDEKGEEITVKKYFNIGVAVQTPDGLMVSVVRDVEKKTILQLAGELQELSGKARDRKITLDELKGSSFTITNYGSYGGTYATPVINPGDVAILGTGKIKERPWVMDGAIAIRKIMPLSITFDHRVVDGAETAQFLNKVISYLEDPARIFIEST